MVTLLRAHGGCLGCRTDEGRGYLRKASGSWKQALIRGCPNGETHMSEPHVPMRESIAHVEGTWGTETSKYPEEKKETSIP